MKSEMNINLETIKIDDVKYINLKTFSEMLGLSRSTIYNMIETETVTPFIKLGKHCMWPYHEVMAFNRCMLNGSSIDERKEMVNKLLSLRQKLVNQVTVNNVTL